MFSVAKLRLADESKKRRAAAATAREVAAGRMTFVESGTLYRTRMEATLASNQNRSGTTAKCSTGS